MNSWPPRNLDYLQRQDPRLYEAIQDLTNGVSTIAQQGSLNPNGNPVAPAAPSGVKVTGKNGHFQVSIQDGNQMYRGIQYQVEHSPDPHFSNPQRVTIGPSRNANIYLGNNVSRYWRVSSFYGSSKPSPYVYHGNAALPQPVSSGSGDGGPAFLDDEGSGTGLPGQPGGAGPVPFRSSTGAAPTRGESANPGGSGGNAIVSPSSVGLPAQVGTPPAVPAQQPVTLPVSATLIASNANRQPIAAALPSADIYVGNVSNLPVAVAVSGDVTLSNAGAVTLNTVNATTGTFGDATHVAQVTVNGKGLVTAAASVAITGAAPTGAAGGDLSGTYPNPSVAKASGDFPVSGNIEAVTVGKGLQVKAGTNARVGTGTLVGGTLLVANTSVTANTLIFITGQAGGVLANIGYIYVSARVNGTSFTVSSLNPLDTSNFAYFLVESI